MGAVVGIVLGAGASTRLGRPKQTLPLTNSTVLGWVVRHAEDSTLDRVVVVLGGAADDVSQSLSLRRASTVGNASYGDGCASSLLAGLAAAGDDVDAIVMLLGDMPGVDASIIDGLVTAWRDERSWASVTTYDDGLGHPFLFSAAAFDDLRRLHGDKAVWKIVDREPGDRVRHVRCHRRAPRDVDTWDDYREVCASFGYEPPADLVPPA